MGVPFLKIDVPSFIRYVQNDLPRCIVDAGDFSYVQGGEDLTGEQLDLERLMLGLRTSNGLPCDFLETFCSKELIQQTIAEGYLKLLENGYLRIPEEHFFISDSIIANLSY